MNTYSGAVITKAISLNCLDSINFARYDLPETAFQYDISLGYQDMIITGGIPFDPCELQLVSAVSEGTAYGHDKFLKKIFETIHSFDENGNITLTIQCSNIKHSGSADYFNVIWHGRIFNFSINYF